MPIARNHSEMVKFSGIHDEYYNQVAQYLSQFQEKALCVLSKRYFPHTRSPQLLPLLRKLTSQMHPSDKPWTLDTLPDPANKLDSRTRNAIGNLKPSLVTLFKRANKHVDRQDAPLRPQDRLQLTHSNKQDSIEDTAVAHSTEYFDPFARLENVRKRASPQPPSDVVQGDANENQKLETFLERQAYGKKRQEQQKVQPTGPKSIRDLGQIVPFILGAEAQLLIPESFVIGDVATTSLTLHGDVSVYVNCLEITITEAVRLT